MKTVFYLIRHGQSLGNFNQTFLGHTDLDLSPLGYTQAELTANALRNVPFDYIYSSDLIRAYNTAVPNAKIHGLEISTEKDLREIYIGDWEGLTVDVIMQEYEEEFINGWRRNFGLSCPPGGESVLKAGARFSNALKSIATRHPGACILVTAHAAVIRSFWSDIIGLAPCDYATGLSFPGNASYSICEYEKGAFKPIAYSVCDHLGDLATFVDERIVEKTN